jgi:methionyl-tRNA synthetase
VKKAVVDKKKKRKKRFSVISMHQGFYAIFLWLSFAYYFTMITAFQRFSVAPWTLRARCRTSTVPTIHRPLSHIQLKAVRKPDQENHQDCDHFSITTPIYYVNGEPHLGHAYTSVVSDIIARYHRKSGKNVFFLSGTDEHGQKVAQSAAASGKTPIEFADDVSAKFQQLMNQLHCSHDDFIRTSEERHKKAVHFLWKTLEDNGHIYLGAYEGWYSIRDEAFYQESELVDGKAPTGAEVSWVKEESYFFRLSQWTEKLWQLYHDHPDIIGPKGRRNEVLAFLTHDGGLKDLSISRTTFSWGVPVPGNPKHVVYVWLDALVNYISALGYPDTSNPRFQKFWPVDVHIVGKDILRFHTIYWPAFLMAANLPIPKKIFAHGWWTKDGEKMSKSVGNVLDPFVLIDTYGVDYVRYFLGSEIHFGNDGDFSHESFAAKINTDLANDYGNLLMRVLVLVNKFCDGKIPAPQATFTPEDEALLHLAKTQTLTHIQSQLQELNVKSVVDVIIAIAKEGNRYINQQEPWSLGKTDLARMNTVLYVLAEVMRVTTIFLEPVIPTSSLRVLEALGVPDTHRTWASVEEAMIPVGVSVIEKPLPLFPRIEEPVAAAMVADNSVKPVTKKLDPITIASNLVFEEKYAQIETDLTLLGEAIVRIGAEIRGKKAEKVAKHELSPLIAELKYLKNKYARNIYHI